MKLLVRSLALQDLCGVDSWKMRRKWGSDSPAAYVIPHREFRATTLLICPPTNSIWRVLSDLRSLFPQCWEDLLGRELVDEGLVLRELNALGIGMRALAGGFWSMYQGDEYEDRHSRIDAWSTVVMVPNALVDAMIEHVRAWVTQAGPLSFCMLDDVEYIRILESGTYESFKTQGVAWALNTGLSSFNAERWSGSEGMIAILQRLVEKVETNLALELHPIAVQSFSGLGINRTLASKINAPGKRRRIQQTTYTPPVEIELAKIDLIFCLRARLARLLGWPQFFGALTRDWVHQRQVADQLPITPGLPYDPLVEMRAYLDETEVRFPIVSTNPFPDSACPATLLV